MRASRPSEKQVRAERAHNFLLDGPIPVNDINEIIRKYNQYFEGTLAHTLQPDHTNAPIRSLATLDDGTLLCKSSLALMHMDPMAHDRARILIKNEDVMQGSMQLLTLLPDDNFAFACSHGVSVWDDDKCVHTFAIDVKNVCALAAMPDSGLATGYRNGTVSLWKDGECSRTLMGHTHWVMALAPLPDGKLASGSLDRTVRVWDTTTGACLLTLTGHACNVSSLAVLPDGKLVSGSWDQTMRVWDLVSGACLLTLASHSHGVTCLSLLPDGELASGGFDGFVRIWDLVTGNCLATLAHPSGVNTLTLLPDKHLAAGTKDGTVCVWQ